RTRAPKQVRQAVLELLADVWGSAESVCDLVKQRPEEALWCFQLISLNDDLLRNLIPNPNRFVVVVCVDTHRSRDEDLSHAARLGSKKLEKRTGEIEHCPLRIRERIRRDELVLEAPVPLVAVLPKVAHNVAFDIRELRQL